MKKHSVSSFAQGIWVIVTAFVGFCGSNTHAAEGKYLLLPPGSPQSYDSDTVGQMPASWSGLPVVNANAYVTNNPSVSSPNSFAVSYTNGNANYLIQTVAPTTFTLTNVGDWVAYQFDVNVDFLNSNNSEGFHFRLWNGNISQLDAGVARIIANSGGWQFIDALGPYLPTIYSFDAWHNFRAKVVLEGTNGPVASPYYGKAYWYVDDALAYTEVWTNKNFNQVREIDTVDIRDVPNLGGRMFIDNMVIEIIPEPSALAFLAMASLMFFRRRSRT